MIEDAIVHPVTPFGEDVLETAYNSVVAELEALPADELTPVNLDVMASVNTAVGVIPELKNLRGLIAKELPGFNLKAFDKLHRYALAAAYAHAVHLAAVTPPDDLRPVFEEAVKLREVLLNDGTALVSRGLLNGDAFKNLKGAVGYKNVQLDLQVLVNVFKANWRAIEGRCGATVEELKRGEKLVAALIEIVGFREQGPAEAQKTADMRARAFTLFTRTYEEARRAVGYLRWREGDADETIPSLWAGRPNGRTGTGKKGAEGAGQAPSEGAAQPAPSPAATPAPGAVVLPAHFTANGAAAASPEATAAALRASGPFFA